MLIYIVRRGHVLICCLNWQAFIWDATLPACYVSAFQGDVVHMKDKVSFLWSEKIDHLNTEGKQVFYFFYQAMEYKKKNATFVVHMFVMKYVARVTRHQLLPGSSWPSPSQSHFQMGLSHENGDSSRTQSPSSRLKSYNTFNCPFLFLVLISRSS